MRMTPSQGVIDAAKAFRKNRCKSYGNGYSERSTDARWVGDLGEACFALWLYQENVPYEWFRDGDVSTSHDITVGRFRMEIKTVKRQVDPKPDYGCLVTERHAQGHGEHGYFFMSYTVPTNTMWFLGAIGRPRFLREAKAFGPGEAVAENYTVRDGHAVRNILISRLMPPETWIKTVRLS